MALPPGWAFRAASAVATGTTTLTITKPAGVVDGDLLVLLLSHEGAGYATVPAGWALVTQNLSSPVRGEMYWKRAASEGANYSVTGLATAACGVISAYVGGPAAGNLVEVATSQANATTFSGNGTPAITTVTPRTLLICAVAANVNLTGGVPEFGCGGTNAFPYKTADPDIEFLGRRVVGGATGIGIAFTDAIRIVPGDTIDAFVAFSLGASTVNVGMTAAFVPDTGSGSGATTTYYLSGKLPGPPRREPWRLAGSWLTTFEDGTESSLDIITTTLLSQTRSDAGQIHWNGQNIGGSAYATNLQGNADILLGRFLTPPLAAQAISCTIDVCMAFFVRWLSNSGYTTQTTANLKLHIYTTVGQTTTVRSVLLNNYVDATALPTTSFKFVGLTSPQTLTGSVLDGDSIVVEIGIRVVSSPTPAPSYQPTQWSEIQALWRGATLVNTASDNFSAFVGGLDAVTGAIVTATAVPRFALTQTIVEQALPSGPTNISPTTATPIPSVPYTEDLYDTTAAAANARGVWYSWTPTRTGTAILTARGAQGQTVFEAYTGGPAYAALVAVPGSYSTPNQGGGVRNLSVLRVPVVAGMFYYLRAFTRPTGSDQIPAPSSGGVFALNIDYVETPATDDVYVAAQNITAWRDGRLVQVQPDFVGDTPSGIAIDYTRRPLPDLNGGDNTDYRLYVALFGVGNLVEILDLTSLNVGTAEVNYIIDALDLPGGGESVNLAALQMTREGFLYVQTYGNGFLRVCGIASGIPAELSASSNSAAIGAVRGLDGLHADYQTWPLASVLTAPPQGTGPWEGALDGGNTVLVYTSGGAYFPVAGDQISRYDVIGNAPLTPLATLTLSGQNPGLKGVTVLPAGGYLVCNGDRVNRLNAAGAVIQTYIPPSDYIVSLADVKLTSDGQRFWTVDLHTATLWQFALTSGALLQTVPTWQAVDNAIQLVLFQPVVIPPVPPACAVGIPSPPPTNKAACAATNISGGQA